MANVNQAPNPDDQTLKCIDCRQDFIFTVGEQRFFTERNFTPPRRCKPCRDAKKLEKQARQDDGGGGGNGGNGGSNNDVNFWAEGNQGGGKRDYDRDSGGRKRRR